MIACAVTDLPQPDSPRMPRVSPSRRVKLTPCTAWATPSRVWNSTRRSSTSSSGADGSKLMLESGDLAGPLVISVLVSVIEVLTGSGGRGRHGARRPAG